MPPAPASLSCQGEALPYAHNMSSVLHPVGPEPEERYWVRRIAVLAAVLLAAVVVVALVTNATRAGSAVQAVPPPPAVPAAVPATPAATSPAPTPSSPSPTPAGSPSERPSASPTPTPSSTAKPARSAQATAKTASPKPSAAPKPTTAPVLAACPVDQLRTTLTGQQSLKIKQRTTFDLSLINGSGRTCYLRVTGDNFVLTIYSGRDRIWSSNDCGTVVPKLSRKLGREQALTWSMRWNGRRSAPACQTRSETPRAGTYWASAQFDNAKPVRLRMVLHA